MNTLHVRWVSLRTDEGIIARGYWDQGMIENIFAGRYWEPNGGLHVEHAEIETGGWVESQPFAVWVIPAMHHVEDRHVDEINSLIGHDRKVVVVLAGDEEQIFPVENLRHPDMILYRMTPWAEQPVHVIPLHDGPKADTWQILGTWYEDEPERDIAVHFRGQENHGRRTDAVAAIRALGPMGYVCETTDGFTQGIPRDEYLEELARSEFVICPAGVAMPSSFRVFEALEAGAIPIVDTRNPAGVDMADYWRHYPLGMPWVSEWADDLRPVLTRHWKQRQRTAARLQGQWFAHRRATAHNMLRHGNLDDRTAQDIHVLISTSPSPLHPDTSMLEETISSVRAHPGLSNAWITVMADGVRPEQTDLADDYYRYVRRVAWKANNVWERVHLHYTDTWLHQAGTCREALSQVTAPLILFMEHDTPFNDRPIDWTACASLVASGMLDVMRFHHEETIPDEHEHMIVHDIRHLWDEYGVIPTCQWSQRPHLARTDWYRNMLRTHFSDDSRTMIEDRMHGFAHEAFLRRGLTGWAEYKIGIYAPNPNHLCRTLHTDGRRDQPKFDMRF